MLAGTQHDRVRKLNRSTAKTARVVDCYARNNLWVNYVRLFYVEITVINEKAVAGCYLVRHRRIYSGHGGKTRIHK
jgi:hypothetical protein